LTAAKIKGLIGALLQICHQDLTMFYLITIDITNVLIIVLYALATQIKLVNLAQAVEG